MSDADGVWRVGVGRQLFIDERFIESSSGLRFRMGEAAQPPEPVIVPDRPWEERGIGGYNTVLREADGTFRAWYTALMITGLPQEGAVRLAYAESRDGVHWVKPELGRVPFRGSSANNIVAPLQERQSQQGACVYRDERAPQAERYKLLTKYRASNAELKAGARNGLYAMHSPDGLRWSVYPDQPCSPVMCDTQNMFFFDEGIGRYVAYTRVAATQLLDEAAKAAGKTGYRSIGRMTSADFRTWSEQRTTLEADAEDLAAPLPAGAVSRRPIVDVYTSCAMKYALAEHVYLMMPAFYHHWDETEFPATLDVQLLTSRDGVAWRRQGDREPFLRKGADDGPAGGMIFANPWLIEMGDELWFYYAGQNRRHVPGGAGNSSGLFRATIRRDGFVAVEAGRAGGWLLTPPLRHDGAALELNFDGSAGGWAQVEFQDESGRPLEGYSAAECDPVVGNSVRRRVTWRGRVGMPASPRAVRMKITLRSARLYAFQFVADAGGGKGGPVR
jgi:hypothetical protein